MPRQKSGTLPICLRLPPEVVKWLESRGGGAFAKALIIMEWHKATANQQDKAQLLTSNTTTE